MSNKIIIIDASESQSHRYKHIPVPIMPTYQNSKATVSRKRSFVRSNVSNFQKYLEKRVNEYNIEPVAKQPRSTHNTKHVDTHSCQEFSATADLIMTLYEGTLGKVSPYKIQPTVMSPVHTNGDECDSSFSDISTPEPPYCMYLRAQKQLQYDKVHAIRIPDRLKLLIYQRADVNKTHLVSRNSSFYRVNTLMSACLNLINKKNISS